MSPRKRKSASGGTASASKRQSYRRRSGSNIVASQESGASSQEYVGLNSPVKTTDGFSPRRSRRVSERRDRLSQDSQEEAPVLSQPERELINENIGSQEDIPPQLVPAISQDIDPQRQQESTDDVDVEMTELEEREELHEPTPELSTSEQELVPFAPESNALEQEPQPTGAEPKTAESESKSTEEPKSMEEPKSTDTEPKSTEQEPVKMDTEEKISQNVEKQQEQAPRSVVQETDSSNEEKEEEKQEEGQAETMETVITDKDSTEHPKEINNNFSEHITSNTPPESPEMEKLQLNESSRESDAVQVQLKSIEDVESTTAEDATAEQPKDADESQQPVQGTSEIATPSDSLPSKQDIIRLSHTPTLPISESLETAETSATSIQEKRGLSQPFVTGFGNPVFGSMFAVNPGDDIPLSQIPRNPTFSSQPPATQSSAYEESLPAGEPCIVGTDGDWQLVDTTTVSDGSSSQGAPKLPFGSYQGSLPRDFVHPATTSRSDERLAEGAQDIGENRDKTNEETADQHRAREPTENLAHEDDMCEISDSQLYSIGEQQAASTTRGHDGPEPMLPPCAKPTFSATKTMQSIAANIREMNFILKRRQWELQMQNSQKNPKKQFN